MPLRLCSYDPPRDTPDSVACVTQQPSLRIEKLRIQEARQSHIAGFHSTKGYQRKSFTFDIKLGNWDLTAI